MAAPTKQQVAQNALAVNEKIFANQVSAGTGLDPRVIYAQEQAEGAYAPGGTGGLNFLNLKASTVRSLGLPFAGESSGGFALFQNEQQAVNASVAEYRSPAIGITAAAPTVEGQIMQISRSPWDQTHYGGGSKLTADFVSLFGSGALGTNAAPAKALTTPLNAEGGGSAADITSIDLGGAAGAGKSAYKWYDRTLGYGQPSLQKAFDDAAAPFVAGKNFFEWITNTKNMIRVGEMIGGGLFIMIGVVMVGRAATSSSSARQVTGAAQTVAKPVTVVRSRSRARSAAAARTQRRAVSESRAADLHTSRVKLNQARATELRTRTKHRRKAKAEQTSAERRAYIRGATDQISHG